MKNIFIHIGQSKTGSTSIRRYLIDHEKQLLEHGLTLYKGLHNSSNHIELFLASIRPERDCFAKQNFQKITFDEHYIRQIKERVHQCIVSAKTPNILFTTEGLSFLRHADEMDRLLHLFKNHTSSITIILYLRNKKDFIKSYTKQIEKRDRAPAQDYDSTLYVKPDTWLIDYDTLIKTYQKAFGKNAVTIVDYDDKFKKQGDIIPSFLNILGVPVDKKYNTSSYFLNQCLRKSLPIRTTLPKALLFPFSRLDPTSRLSKKALRIIYGKKLNHMTHTGAAFALHPTDHPQVWEIFWRGKKLGETIPHPVPDPATHSDIWLLATGPSVKPLDLRKLKDHSVMGLNGAIAVCQQHHIKPDYYVITDRDFFRNRMDLVKEVVLSGAHCYFSFDGISLICQQEPELLKIGKISLLETVNRYYATPKQPLAELKQTLSNDSDMVIPNDFTSKIGWSHQPTKGIFTAKTIAYIGCQIAAALNPKNIFILGMDLTAPSNAPTRAYEEGENARPTSIQKDYPDFILPSFQLIPNIKLTTKIWNLSLESRLPSDILPKISFEQALTNELPTNP